VALTRPVPWQRPSPFSNPLLVCHPDRSEAEGRDLRFS
jgi:hypothetical protein